MQAQDDFDSTAKIRISLPSEIYVKDVPEITAVSETLDINANIEARLNKYIYIENAFPNGMPMPPTEFSFTIRGFDNPQTATKTQDFNIQIYYIEDENIISNSQGKSLKVEATASDQVNFRAENSDAATGASGQLTFYGSTQGQLPIERGSYLRVFIPSDFKIGDEIEAARVAATCTAISGFSDQISCEFERYRERDGGRYLRAKNGFDSATSEDGEEFSFFISEIMNPFTTAPTASFGFEIYDNVGGVDGQGGLQYYFTEDLTLSMAPSVFSFAYVESHSNVNGVSSIFEITISLGVDTPAGAQIAIGLPEELEFDSEQAFECSGRLNAPGSIECDQRTGRMPFITLLAEPNGNIDPEPFRNGTTLILQLGHIKNPLSYKATSSFYIASIIPNPEAGTVVFAEEPPIDPEQYYFINENDTGLTIKNSEAGSITIDSISHTTNELD